MTANSEGSILIVDDDTSILQLYRNLLQEQAAYVDTTDNIRSMEEMISRTHYDVMLLDLMLGADYGLDHFKTILEKSPKTRVIILTENATVEAAVASMQMGASNFLTKSTNPRSIAETVRTYLDLNHPSSEGLPFSPHEFGLIGESSTFLSILHRIARVADVDSTVLITGESGTGKELVAKALHSSSKRNVAAFEAINCAAIPETLLESELFGHKRGSYTDAKADRKGLFETCTGGTLFLDEIGDMPLNLQTKLLRVLQEREIRPIGASKSIKVDVRVLAATNTNLLEKVKAGLFRADLYYRVSVITLDLPALRDRREDIPILANYFVRICNQRFGQNVDPPAGDVMARLLSYDWPGNVRELYNAIERGVVLARGNSLDIVNIFDGMIASAASAPGLHSMLDNVPLLPLVHAKEVFEKAYLQRLLDIAQGNVSQAARISGQYRANLYRMMDKHHIHPVRKQ